ncbi:chorismate mutase [Saccharopolyspora mangrovi]|uniref:Chorismate mutase n=1 Tax=Saccharopolyspora mangrovi TaxID=3082379 RepID=A0ABU6AFX3_9PSEU|nr:chorismate mutase [Saccharopolyspora sp. S2-29]MEB3370230.1 chorismate mutase [Saccharopolyspora sp. S2-29]
MRSWVVGGAVVAAALGLGAPAQAQGALDPLVGSAAERVVLSDQVAAAKWGTDSPIEDPEREQQVLDGVAARAVELGLDPEEAERVFRDQIEASKLVQRALHAHWTANPDQQPTERPDLGEIRPELDRLGEAILVELRDTDELRDGPPCTGHLAGAYARTARDLDALHQAALGRAVPSICT